MNKKKIIPWILFFLIFLLISQFFSKKQSAPPPELTAASIGLMPAETGYVTEQEVKIKVRNNTAATFTVPSNCPKNPLRVLVWNVDKFEEKSVETQIKCELAPPVTLAPNEEKQISYTYWNHSLFGTPGRYKVQLEYTGTSSKAVIDSPEFTVVEPGFLRKMYRVVLNQPIYNILIFFLTISPFHDLGIAIILLTLLIRLILLIPSQRAIVSQRRMQELQPKLDHIKKKYEGNQEKIAQETMALWKEHKVNPFGSCLPLIIQFPVLIALYYVISTGLNPDNSYLIYSYLKNIDLNSIHTMFLGILDLTKTNAFVLPLIVGGLQFFQLKLTMLKKKPQQPQEEHKASEMETANKTMMYIMPVMIALFTASVPAGVGLYWGISTLFAIVQQIIVNRKPSVYGKI